MLNVRALLWCSPDVPLALRFKKGMSVKMAMCQVGAGFGLNHRPWLEQAWLASILFVSGWAECFKKWSIGLRALVFCRTGSCLSLVLNLVCFVLSGWVRPAGPCRAFSQKEKSVRRHSDISCLCRFELFRVGLGWALGYVGPQPSLGVRIHLSDHICLNTRTTHV